MQTPPVIDVIIPAYNEEESIGLVLDDIPKDLVRYIYVANNASTDSTAEVARNHGAIVVDQPIMGYGNACLKGMEAIAALDVQPDIIVYLDGDYSDHPEEMYALVNPIITKDVDLVIGSRALGERAKGSMMPQQIFGNWLATTLIKMFYGYSFSDLGPFRAIKYDKLMEINMVDKTFGWTVEMQIKAAKKKYKTIEIPVTYRERIGISKVSGTLYGTIMAGYKIIWTIFKYL